MEFAKRCIERAAGNPLFLEQLLRHVETTADGHVPGSVKSLVQARMDQLDTLNRQALQAASIFGQRFSLEALRNLIDKPNYSCVRLVEHFLIRPQGGDFLFAHALIREGVYESLLSKKRHSCTCAPRPGSLSATSPCMRNTSTSRKILPRPERTWQPPSRRLPGTTMSWH